MTEPLSPAELEVGRQIWDLADAGTRLRDPNAVVRAVVARSETRRSVWLPLAAVASTLVVLVVAVVAVEHSAPLRVANGGRLFRRVDNISEQDSAELARGRAGD